jgi:hypothetical protein
VAPVAEEIGYNRSIWQREKMQNCIWLGIVDYGRVAWNKTLAKCKTNPASARKTKDKFRVQWCSGSVFAEWINGRPHWKLTGPRSSLRT